MADFDLQLFRGVSHRERARKAASSGSAEPVTDAITCKERRFLWWRWTEHDWVCDSYGNLGDWGNMPYWSGHCARCGVLRND